MKDLDAGFPLFGANCLCTFRYVKYMTRPGKGQKTQKIQKILTPQRDSARYRSTKRRSVQTNRQTPAWTTRTTIVNLLNEKLIATCPGT